MNCFFVSCKKKMKRWTLAVAENLRRVVGCVCDGRFDAGDDSFEANRAPLNDQENHVR